MEANARSSWPGIGGGSAGFSRNASIVRPSLAVLMTPNALASGRGTGSAATVTPAPQAMCWSIICIGSMRNTWSAPNTATMSGLSSKIRFSDW